MANIAQIIESLAKGKGVFKGDPLFLMADGQVVDKDGREVAPASAIGAAAYTAHVGFMPLTAGKFYTDGTDVYVFGSGSLAKI